MAFNYETHPQVIRKALAGGTIKKILAVRISRVGDLLFTTPSIRCLKARFPKTEIQYLTNGYAESAIRHNPHVTKIHLLERKGLAWRFFKKGRVLKALQNEGFHMVIFFRWRKEFHGLVTQLKTPFVFRPAFQTGFHLAEGLLKGFAVLDVPDDGLGMEAHSGPEDQAAVDAFLKAHNLAGTSFFVFHAACFQTIKKGIGADAAKRTWPMTHWSGLIKAVHEVCHTLPVLSEMSAGDALSNQRLKASTGLPLPVFSTDSTGAFAALLRRAGGFVGLDSGPLHVASAMQVPTIALFGPSKPALTGPFRNPRPTRTFQADLPCVPCKGKKIRCGDNRCMQAITVEEVLAAIQNCFKQQAQQ